MCKKCNEKICLSSKYIGKKYRVELWNESKSGHHNRWAVVFGDDNIVTSCFTKDEALELMDIENTRFEAKAWQTLREWFDSIHKAVEDQQFRQDQPHLWWQYLGLRMAMNDIALSALGMNWFAENRDGVCNMFGIGDCEDKAVNHFEHSK